MSTRRRMQRYPAHCYWSSSCNAELRCVKSLWVRSTGSTWVWGLVRHGYGKSQTGVVRSWSGPGSNLVWVLVRHGLGQSQTGVVRSWFEPGQVLVRSWFGFWFNMVMTKPNRGGQVLVRSWFEPGQVHVRTWFGFWFDTVRTKPNLRVRVSKGASHCISNEPLDLF